MKLTLASLALPLLGAAAPAPAPSGKPFSAQTDTTQMPFSVLAARSASPIHYQQMQASSTKFWLGGQAKTNSSCPAIAADKGSCPPGDQTYLGREGNSMYSMVPGAQRVYVDNHGALRFTQPHSNVIPEGATNEGFSHVHAPTVAGSKSPDHYNFTNWGAHGFMACPASDNLWQVFAAIQNATVPQGNITACLGFSALAVPYNNTLSGAWQYN